MKSRFFVHLVLVITAMAMLGGCGRLANRYMTTEDIINPSTDNFRYLAEQQRRTIPWPQGGVVGKTTPGAYRKEVQGLPFQPVESIDPRNAIIYIYRPATHWDDLELQAPGIFIQEDLLFGLSSGSYRWIELPAGEYDFYSKRPFGPLYVKKVFDIPMLVRGGEVYYFRYSETDPVDMSVLVPDPGNWIQDGPLQQVPSEFAVEQMKLTVMDEQGVLIGAHNTDLAFWKPFEAFPETKVGDIASDVAPTAASDFESFLLQVENREVEDLDTAEGVGTFTLIRLWLQNIF